MPNMATQDITDRMTLLGRLAYEYGVAGTYGTALDAWVVEFTDTYAELGDARIDAALDGTATDMAQMKTQGATAAQTAIVSRARVLVSSAWFYGAFSVAPASSNYNTVLTQYAAELAADKANKSIDTGGALRTFLNVVAGLTYPTWLTAVAPADYSDASYVVI